MTDDTTPTTDANRTDDSPLQQSRRMLLRLLGSATAVGAATGIATAGGDDNDHEKKDDHQDCKKRKHERNDVFKNLVHFDGLSLLEDEVRLDSLHATPEIDGESTTAFAADGFEATVEDDTVTETDVDSVEMHEKVEKKVTWLVDHLADGTVPDDLDHMPDWANDHLKGMDETYFKQLKKDMKRRDGPAHAMEHYLEHGGMMGGLFLLAALLLVILVLIVLIFLIL